MQNRNSAGQLGQEGTGDLGDEAGGVYSGRIRKDNGDGTFAVKFDGNDADLSTGTRGMVAAVTAISPSMLYVLLSRALCSFALPAQVVRSSPCAQCDAAAVGRSNFRVEGTAPQPFKTLDLT